MNVSAFVASLKYMGLGMLGIFAVMLVIYVLIAVLNRVTAEKGGREHKQQ